MSSDASDRSPAERTVLEESLIRAQRLLESGDRAGAEALCREVLDREPCSAQALHLLGVLAVQSRRLDEAVALMRRAVELDPSKADLHNNLGVALAEQQRFDEAAAMFRRAAELDPRFPDAAYNLAKALRAAGRLEESLRHYQAAVELNGRSPHIYFDLGNALRALGRLDEAAAAYQRAVALKPDYLKAHANLGHTCRDQRRFDKAEECYRAALRIDPGYVPAHLNLGSLAGMQKRFRQAEQHFREAERLNPASSAARNGLGKVLAEQARLAAAAALLERWAAEAAALVDAHLKLSEKLRAAGRLDEALGWARRAAEAKPDSPHARQAVGLVLSAQGDLDGAEACYREALRLQPDLAEGYNNLAVAVQTRGELDQALRLLEKAISLKPRFGVAHLNRAVLWLRRGEYQRGWVEYEWRRHCEEFRFRVLPKPAWVGQAMPEGTVLLHAEQGLGDTLQFVRYAALVKQRVGRVVVECQAPLERLLARTPGIDQLVARGQPLPPHDAQCPMASLPGVFETDLGNVPADVPYIRPDDRLVATWRRRLDEQPGFRVGIAWQGNPKYAGDAYRSIPLRHFAPLAAVPGDRLVSLQTGFGAEQIAALGGLFPLVDFGESLDADSGAFMDTAAILENLDLLITSDTALPHLAGAMDRPVWVLLSTCSDWRWLEEREDCPWYPSMRLLRQARAGDWIELFARVADQLRRVVAGDRSLLRPSRRALGRPIEIPVGPGELIDRLSILEIKLQHITDPGKLRRVREESARLRERRDRLVPSSAELNNLAAELKSVNERLWRIEDDIRACEARDDFGPAFIELARSVYKTNDRRAELKRAIDQLLGSPLSDAKQYVAYATERS